MNYVEARRYIESLQARGWRLGLDRMEFFLERLGNPHEGLRAFHVAGTNGKGSATAMIAACLQEAGNKVGAFYSPYVYDFRERIQINGEMISKADVARLTADIKPIADELAYEEVGGPTEFEFKTAMAFVYWKEMGVDYAVLEVGLGGRLDATNVIQEPVCSVITEIGMDHQQYLGETIKKIAYEKAGIIKAGRPVVTGVTDETAFQVIMKIAEERSCPLSRIHADDFRKRNRMAAAEAVRVGLGGDVRLVVPEVRLPGRMEVVSEDPRVIFDGAHNEQAIRAVLAYIPGQIVCVYSAATGHAPLTAVLAERCRDVFVAPMKHARGMGAAELGATHGTVHESIAAAIGDIREGETLLVTGSFFLLAEAKEALRDLTSVS
jgi:dihydrofolate synthase/folylpolyglutamate synthase